MNLNKLTTLTKGGYFQTNRYFSVSPVSFFIQKWRKDHGLPLNPNAYGVLTDKPDYTFLDGRTTPYGVRQKRRIFKQREIAQRIITLTKEVDFAVERHKRLQLEEVKRAENILANKLKPKGDVLLKEKWC